MSQLNDLQPCLWIILVLAITIAIVQWSENDNEKKREARRAKIEEKRQAREAAKKTREAAREAKMAVMSRPTLPRRQYDEAVDEADATFHKSLTGNSPTLAEKKSYYVTRYLTRITEMSPRQFEEFILYMFEDRGYALQLTKHTGDEGIDIYGTSPQGEPVAFQCKRYKHSIGQPIVRDFFGAMIHSNAKRGFIVTTSYFTESARSWAQGKSIEFIDGGDLSQTITKIALAEFEAARHGRTNRKLDKWIPPPD